MNTLITKICLLLLVAVLNSSCAKFLDQKQSTSLVSPNTLSDLQGLMDDAGNVMNGNLTPSLGEASSDDIFLTDAAWETLTTRDQHFYKWEREPYYFPNDWSRSYMPVFSANYCLDQLTKNERTTDNAASWDQIKGSALFYRSYNFLNLLWNFSNTYDPETSKTDAGIVLRLDANFNTASQRANVAACYQQVIEDTRNAIPLLPNLPQHTYRPSRAAAYGLLARAFLSMRQYDSAYKYADLCLEQKSGLMNYQDYNLTPTRPFPAFNTEIVFYSEIYTFTSIIARGMADTLLYSSYTDNDLRKTAFFNKNGNYNGFKGSYSSGFFTGITTSEIYLVRAECNARLGKATDALNDLNHLLKNRHKAPYTPIVDIPNDALLKLVLQERRKELIRRGLRWMDIKRLNAEGQNINLTRKLKGVMYTLKANAPYFALPLPQDIIDITGMLQNP